jgi:hypothetical protein
MKTLALALTATFAVAASTLAGPLHKENVAADAQWLVHLDVNNMLQTDLGKWFGEAILDKQFAKATRDLNQQFGIDFDWRQVQSLTAYGSQFKPKGVPNGVLLIQGFDFGKALDSVIERLETAMPAGNRPLQKTHEDNGAFYSLNNDVFGVALPGNLFLLSKSKDEVQKARDVVTGASPNLTSTKAAARVPDPAKAGFLLGLVNSLDALPLPPQAKGLKKVEGAQLVMGEKAETVFLKLALNARDAESATQMQQALQGVLALGNLMQIEDQNAQKLIQGTKVSGTDTVVTVKLDLPASDVIAAVKAGQAKKAAPGDAPKKPRRARKPATE